MPTDITIGFSKHANSTRAAEEAIEQIKSAFGSKNADFILVFGTIQYDANEYLPILNKAFGRSKVIGCSTAGIILTESIEICGLGILAICSDEMHFGIGSVNNIRVQDIQNAGTVLGRNNMTDFGQHGRQLFLFLVDGHLENNSLLLKGIQDVMGNVFPIVGAGSCDDFHYADTYQLYRNRVLQHSATGVIFGGHINVGVGGRHGWKPLGRPRIINKVNGPIIRIIDQKKAVSLYEEYLNIPAEDIRKDLSKMTILYPLGIKIEGSQEYLLRNAVDILADGSIVCQGDIPEGAEVHIMIGNKESAIQAAFEASQESYNNLLGKEAKLVLVFNSMSRLKLLGRRAFEEIKKVKTIFGDNVPIFGMYSNGEIFPFQTIERIQKPHLQNESIVVLAVG